MGEKIIKVLILEDNPDDAELNQYQLKKAGLDLKVRKVDNKSDFVSSLKQNTPDIILSDFNLPQFNGLEAIKLAQKICSSVPVIIVSGVIGEERAVSLLKEGAVDFVLKDNLTRLPGVVTRALIEADHIQKHKQAELALQASEEKYRAVMESAQDAIILINSKGTIDSWNYGAEEIFGYAAHEIIGKGLTQIIPSNYRDKHLVGMHSFFKSGNLSSKGKVMELEGLKKNGEVFPLELSLSTWQSGGEKFVSGIIRDISQRKKIQEALQISEQRYRGLFMQAGDAIFLTDLKGNIMDSNHYAKNFYGYNEIEFKKMNFAQLFDHKEVEIEAIINKENFDDYHLTKAGKQVVVSINSSRIAIGNNMYVQYICRDVTMANKRKAEIITLSQAITQSPVSVVITDIEGNITYVNPKFEEATGYNSVEVLGKNPRILKSGYSSGDTYKDLWAQITAGNIWTGELHNKKKDGSLYWEQASISGIKNEKGELIAFVALKEDITWRKKILQDLINSEERYRNVISMAPDPILEIDLDGYISSANPSFNNFIGISIKEVPKVHLTDQRFITPQSAMVMNEKFQNVINDKAVEPFEIELINKNQSLVVAEVNLKLISSTEKTIVVAIYRDISERKKANELLLEAIMSTEDKERQRISSEVHDGLQQTLICASLEFQQLTVETSKSGFSKNNIFHQGVDFLNQAINESRNIAHTLLPKTIEDNGLKASLEEMVSRLELLSKVKFELSYDFDESLIDKSISLRLFNIVQEAINNALKHAHPTIIKVSINRINDNLILSVHDDGIGFEPDIIDSKDSFGIISMEHKANAISSKFKIESSPGNGCLVQVKVPIS